MRKARLWFRHGGDGCGAAVAAVVAVLPWFEPSGLKVLGLGVTIVVAEAGPTWNVDGVMCAGAVEEPMGLTKALVALGM